MKYPILCALAILAALLCGCGGGGGSSTQTPVLNSSPAITTLAQARQHCSWTILVYLDADNDLESIAMTNLNQMEKIGSTEDVHVIAQVDRIPGHDTSNGNWTDTRRYLITRDTDELGTGSIRLDASPLGELDMGDWRTLRDFVEWGRTQFPADHYCLVIWDHGTGWQFVATRAVPKFKHIAVDDTSGSSIDVTSLPDALAGQGMDVVAFDACLMSQLEVAYEIKDCAGYMVGSAALVPSSGYNYYTWLSQVSSSADARGMCGLIVNAYAATYPEPRRSITHSAIDLSRVDDVADAASVFAQVLAANSYRSQALADARDAALNYSTADGGAERHYLDLVDYAGKCASAIGSNASAAYSALSAAVNAAVVAETHNRDTAAARGLGVYVPPAGTVDSRYATLRFAADTHWNEWLQAQTQ